MLLLQTEKFTFHDEAGELVVRRRGGSAPVVLRAELDDVMQLALDLPFALGLEALPVSPHEV